MSAFPCGFLMEKRFQIHVTVTAAKELAECNIHRKRENILVACICFFFIGAINTESLIKLYRT